MKKIAGFTLIELLAVIIILAVILAITVPSIFGLIENIRKSAFEDNIKLIIKTVETKVAINDNYDVSIITAGNMDDELEINNDNYESISISIDEENKINVDAVGKDKWEGLEVHGTKGNLVFGSDGSDSTCAGDSTTCLGLGDSYLTIDYTKTEIAYEYSNASTELALTSYDNGYGTINLDFSFPFGNTSYSTLYVGSNGYITFDSSNAGYWYNYVMAASFPTIAPLWENILFNKTVLPSSGVFYDLGTEGSEKYLLIEYRDVLTSPYQTVDSTVDFEVKLYEDGTIKMSYKDTTFGNVYYDYGIEASIGVASNLGFSQYSYNTASIHDNLTIQYTASAPYTKTIALAPDTCFTFDSVTGTITDYDEVNSSCPARFGIPSTIGGVTVQNIGDSAFYESGVRSVVIPNTVLTIDDYAFESTGLECLNIPSSVTTIGEYAFDDNKLTSFTLPDTVSTVEEGAFGNNNMTNLTIESGTTSIGPYAFAWNLLNCISIPNSVTTINEGAFDGNQITSLTIPSSVITIGDDAFSNNLLVNIAIPGNVANIGENAFYSNLLTGVTFGNGVQTIGYEAFSQNQLTNVSFPDSLISIGDYSFYYNQISGGITIPNNVNYIGNSAFNANDISSLAIGNKVEFIGRWAFDGQELTTLTIPDSVTTIGPGAFRLNKLTNLVIGSGVISMGEEAFNGNLLPDDQAFIYGRNADGSIDYTNLVSYGGVRKSLAIPGGVITIGSGTFLFAGLTSITIPNGVTTIGEDAFSMNELTSVAIPNSVISIGKFAFSGNLIPQDFATIDNTSGSVAIASYAFNANGSDGTITISPRYLR